MLDGNMEPFATVPVTGSSGLVTSSPDVVLFGGESGGPTYHQASPPVVPPLNTKKEIAFAISFILWSERHCVDPTLLPRPSFHDRDRPVHRLKTDALPAGSKHPRNLLGSESTTDR